MHNSTISKSVFAALIAAFAFSGAAQAFTQPVTFNVLNASTTLVNSFGAGDNLRLDTLVTTEVGALRQSITFTVAADVDAFVGEAVWEISSATSTLPRLIGVNIDLFDSSNALVGSDSFVGVLGGFAVSALSGAINPGVYTLVATGTGVRTSSLDVSVGFISSVPEPLSISLLMSGLGVVGFVAVRRRQADRPSPLRHAH